jgi:hypothetical protein|tara:strand:+ start:6584 stop:7354 length:771 start_codon:yes stop_codon:yes gene_type:complete
MGIIHDMTNEVYHATAGISSSPVKTVYKKSLSHWKGEKRRQTAAFTMGSAVHALLLEENKNIVVKGPKTKASKAFKDLEETLDGEQILLTEVEWYTAKAISKGALSNPTIKSLLRHKDRQNEVSIFVECEDTGLMLKTRPDLMILSEQGLYDVKTTQDASPRGFSKECTLYAYDIQAAFYLYVCQLAGLDVKEFSFLAVEKSAPYVSHMHVVGPELLESATIRMKQVLRTIAEANNKEEYGTGWGDYTILGKPSWL